MEVKTFLPVFTGYYNTIFDQSDFVVDCEASLDSDEFKKHYSQLSKEGVTQEFFNDNFYKYADFSECFEDASASLCSVINRLHHDGIILNVTYEKTVSPKYYNFVNDSINCIIEFDENKLQLFINNHQTELKAYIKNKYTSCDGFISSYSNDVNDWNDVKQYGEHEVGSVLEFMLNILNKDAEYSLLSHANLSEYFYDFKFDYKECIKDFKACK